MSRAGYQAAISPELTDASGVLRARVNQLARAGALDQGSGHVFDPMIAAWVEQWTNRVDSEHDARQSVLQQRVLHAEAELERLRALADLNGRRLAENGQRLAWLLGGADPDRNPVLHPRRPAAEQPGHRPDAARRPVS
jgi:hypothetical protein